MTKSYELVVVGGGPGGYTAALHAAELGVKTALVEMDLLGGTCLNRGCIPSKTYLKHAEIIESIHKAKDWGIETGEMSFSFEKMKKRKNDIIDRLRKGIASLLKQGKIDVYHGYGSVAENGIVTIETEAGKESIQADKVIIATGSKPGVPPIKGLESVSFDTSDTVFDLPVIPKQAIIIGGGVIGMELACIFASLKSEVTVIEAANRIIPTEDEEASHFLLKALKKKEIKIYTHTKVQEVSENGKIKHVVCVDKNGDEFSVSGDSLIICTGRVPNTKGVSEIDLEKEGPFIQVNEKMQTSVPTIYAIGDVIGGWQLAHAASAEGIVAANNTAGIHDIMDYKIMPRCIYTIPEIAGVGLTEEGAKQKGIKVHVEKFDFAGNGKALAIGEPYGFTKVIYEAKYGEIIGVIMAGSHVTEMISEASAFIYLEGTVEEAAKMVHPHPTISETFYEAAVKIVRELREKQIN